MNKGFVKLHRGVLDNQLFSRDRNAMYVFITLLLLVDRNSGSYNGGRFKLAAITGVKPITCYRILKRLENETMVKLKVNAKYTEITVVNWEKYQSSETQMKRLVNETETQVNTKQEERSKKKNINTNVELRSQYQQLHDKLCTIYGKNPNQYKLSTTRRELLKRRLKDSTEDNIIKASEAITKSPFHMGDNDRSWIADPYWVLKSFEKTEEWAGRYESSGFKGNLTELEI